MPEFAQTTLADYVRDHYVRSRLSMRERSAEQLYIACGSLSRHLGREARLSDLTADTLIDFLRAYSASHADATTNSKRRILLQIWREACRHGHLSRPVPEIPRLTERLPMPTAWTIAEVSRVIKAARQEEGRINGIRSNLWFVSLCLALLDTGARIGAMLLVRRESVRVEDPTGILLQSEFSKVKRSEWRALHSQTVDVLKQVWFPERELMWPWPHHRSWLTERFRRICVRAKVPHGKGNGGLFYLFRRTSGTLVEMQGGDGSKQLGNGRDVFRRYYLDQRLAGRGQLDFIPRPEF
jgi:integrase